jgi:hypothetical protein
VTSPTQRSLARLRKDGWTAGVVERFNQHVGPHGIRQDFCGGIDLIAFRGERAEEGVLSIRINPGEILGVQCCAASGLAAHRTKLLAEPRMREWVAAGGRLVIQSWGTLACVKKDGKKGKARRWTCREVELRLEDFPTSYKAPGWAQPEVDPEDQGESPDAAQATAVGAQVE